MFKNLFNEENGKTKSIFLAGWEVHLNGDQLCENFIATQITDKKTAQSFFISLELIFENEKLTKAYQYENYGTLEKSIRELANDETDLTYRQIEQFEENKLLYLSEDDEGIHQIGGEKPINFQIPKCSCKAPFQYLGFINHTDKYFSWLPFNVNLTCPIYLNFDKVFLDYSDPDRPILINKEEVESAGTSYEDDLNENTEIVFNEMKFNFYEEGEFTGSNIAGIPNWIQYPDIPVCPVSGNRMKFLCQINGGVSVKRSNVKPKDEWYRQYFEKMNFWGDGDLYVFFEPTSKVACYLIQNT
ncbi:MAG: hypothetical protein JNM67_11560 [Bacteroidetes bacterium]|nr:hypothetical protein [Bacteroidota bacterium]